MSDDLINLQSRNAQLRAKIEQLVEGADKSVQDEVRRIASEQLPAVADPVETLQRVHDNLQRQADALLDAGVAKAEDFEGV
jgi:hypothetical protein